MDEEQTNNSFGEEFDGSTFTNFTHKINQVVELIRNLNNQEKNIAKQLLQFVIDNEFDNNDNTSNNSSDVNEPKNNCSMKLQEMRSNINDNGFPSLNSNNSYKDLNSKTSLIHAMSHACVDEVMAIDQLKQSKEINYIQPQEETTLFATSNSVIKNISQDFSKEYNQSPRVKLPLIDSVIKSCYNNGKKSLDHEIELEEQPTKRIKMVVSNHIIKPGNIDLDRIELDQSFNFKNDKSNISNQNIQQLETNSQTSVNPIDFSVEQPIVDFELNPNNFISAENSTNSIFHAHKYNSDGKHLRPSIHHKVFLDNQLDSTRQKLSIDLQAKSDFIDSIDESKENPDSQIINIIEYNMEMSNNKTNPVPNPNDWKDISNRNTSTYSNDSINLQSDGLKEIEEYVDSRPSCIPFSIFEELTENQNSSTSNPNLNTDFYDCNNKDIKLSKILSDLYDKNIDLKPEKLAKEQDEMVQIKSSTNILSAVSCLRCREELTDVSLLPLHLKKCNNVTESLESLVCPHCDKKFIHKTAFTRHMVAHENNNCSKCDKMFCNQKKLKLHLKNEHNISDDILKTYSCSYCDKEFRSRKILHHHMKCHTQGSQIVCETCGEISPDSDKHNEHIKEHYKCNNCNLSFSRKQHYQHHLKSHMKNDCKFCNEKFSKRNDLYIHCKLYHKDLPKNFISMKRHQCNLCDRSFGRPSLLQHHLKVHQGVKPLECKICNKGFCYQRSLQQHLKGIYHEQMVLYLNLQKSQDSKNDTEFTCDVCGLKMPTETMLRKHKKVIHKSSLEYKCPHCPYTTHQKFLINRHVKLHVERKKFVCEKCGRSFSVYASLKEHYVFVHSEKRSFKCNTCAKTFKNKSTLSRHYLTHSDNRPYKCHCGADYKRASHLRRHMILAHNQVLKMAKPSKKLQYNDGSKVTIVNMENNNNNSNTFDQSVNPNINEKNKSYIMNSEKIELSQTRNGTEEDSSRSITINDADIIQLVTIHDSDLIHLVTPNFDLNPNSASLVNNEMKLSRNDIVVESYNLPQTDVIVMPSPQSNLNIQCSSETHDSNENRTDSLAQVVNECLLVSDDQLNRENVLDDNLQDLVF